jgi:hypothetical protein
MSLADTGLSTVIWIGLGLAAWLLAGVVVALTVAGMLRRREQQVTWPPDADRPRRT